MNPLRSKACREWRPVNNHSWSTSRASAMRVSAIDENLLPLVPPTTFQSEVRIIPTCSASSGMSILRSLQTSDRRAAKRSAIAEASSSVGFPYGLRASGLYRCLAICDHRGHVTAAPLAAQARRGSGLPFSRAIAPLIEGDLVL